MKFCGIDLHSNNSVVVITDETDRILASHLSCSAHTKMELLLPDEVHRQAQALE